MGVIVEIERYFPPDFFASASAMNNQISRSEQLSKASLCVALDFTEDELRKGEPNKNEPDWIVGDSNGIEVTFASKREPSSVFEAKTGKFKVGDLEQEIIDKITTSVKEKFDKRQNGNYQGITNVTVFVICLDPLLNWYGYLYNFDHPELLRKRDSFFQTLYDNYIKDAGFENIYIFQLTEFMEYILYDIKSFITNPDVCITQLGIKNTDKLPHCKVVNQKKNDASTLNGDPYLSYQFRTVIGKVEKQCKKSKGRKDHGF